MLQIHDVIQNLAAAVVVAAVAAVIVAFCLLCCLLLLLMLFAATVVAVVVAAAVAISPRESTCFDLERIFGFVPRLTSYFWISLFEGKRS